MATIEDHRTPDDLLAARAIMDELDGYQLVLRVTDYYRDSDRAERTPRAVLYLHLGLLAGAYMRLRAHTAPRFAVVAEHDHHGGAGWAIFDGRQQRTTGGWFADRLAADRTAADLNDANAERPL